jgi:hypothetical protein
MADTTTTSTNLDILRQVFDSLRRDSSIEVPIQPLKTALSDQTISHIRDEQAKSKLVVDFFTEERMRQVADLLDTGTAFPTSKSH